MKYDAVGLIYKGAMALKREDNGGAAYALLQLANNLRLLMRDEATLDQWRKVYVGQDNEPFDLNALIPVSP